MDTKHLFGSRKYRTGARLAPRLGLVIIFALLMAMINTGKPVQVSAAAIWSNNEFGIGLTGQLDDAGVLTIIGAGAMANFTSGTSPVYSLRTAITGLVVSSGVTSIGAYLCQGCTALTSISLAGTVTAIGTYAFMSCTSLPVLAIPDSITTLGNYVFYGCSGAASISIGSGITMLASAFRNCSGLTSAIVPNNVASLGNYCFGSCSNLASVTIGSGMASISNYAFQNCSRLATFINKYNGSQTIGASSLSGCGSAIGLKSAACYTANSGFAAAMAAIGYTVNNIYSFGANVSGILNTTTGALIISGTGAMDLWTAAGSPLYPVRTTVKSIVIESGVTSVGTYCCQGCTSLISVSLSESVATVCAYAFANCTSLPALTLPPGISIIYAGTFSGCSKLASIHIPDGTTQIGPSAFAGCLKLTSITLPDTVTSIASGAFNYCTGLASITVPDKVTAISECAFQGCTGLVSAVIGNGCTFLGDYAFDGCTRLAAAAIGSSMETIGYSAFRSCPLLADITNSYNGSQAIDPGAFTGAGSGVVGKTASCCWSNTNFITLITAAGYMVSELDTIPPEATSVLSSDDCTGLSVTITITATDNCALDMILLPDGSEVSGSTAVYTVIENGIYTFTIKDTAGNQLVFPVTVASIGRAVSVTHPAESTYLIDPNTANPFSAMEIELANNSANPVCVSVLSLAAVAGGSLILRDVGPAAFPDWSKLGHAQTCANIVLGIGVKEPAPAAGGWQSITQATPLCAAQIQTKIPLGVLEPNGGTGHLYLAALCGLAWDMAYTASHSLVLVFDAC